MLISEAYREQNRKLHEDRPDYGSGSHRWAKLVTDICEHRGLHSVLDYGCGKGALKAALSGLDVREYDPAIPGKDAAPEPADLVVCTDVLEHIEPELLDAVLDDLARLTGKVGLLVASTVPARKCLPDGRNAHLIVESADWWRERIAARWDVALKSVDPASGVLFIVEPKC